MQCTCHATTKLFQYITYCHFCWINCNTVQDNTILQRQNMSGHTTIECPINHEMYRLETSWNYITQIFWITSLFFMHTPTHCITCGVIQKTSGSKSNYREDQVLGTGHCGGLSEQRWRKPTVELEGSTGQQSASPLKPSVFTFTQNYTKSTSLDWLHLFHECTT